MGLWHEKRAEYKQLDPQVQKDLYVDHRLRWLISGPEGTPIPRRTSDPKKGIPISAKCKCGLTFPEVTLRDRIHEWMILHRLDVANGVDPSKYSEVFKTQVMSRAEKTAAKAAAKAAEKADKAATPAQAIEDATPAEAAVAEAPTEEPEAAAAEAPVAEPEPVEAPA